jgi:hypothetical protein
VPLTHIIDHQERAVARLASQYQDSVTVPALLRLATAEHQVLEDALWADFELTLASATGAQLDLFGKLVDQARGGMDDATYRLWIQARSRLNRSSGTGPDILAIFGLVVPVGASITLKQWFPKGFVLRIGALPLTNADMLLELLAEATEAGTYSVLEFLSGPPAAAFTFSGGGGLGFDAGIFASAQR